MSSLRRVYATTCRRVLRCVTGPSLALRKRARQGNVLVLVLTVMGVVGLAAATFSLSNLLTTRTITARSLIDRSGVAAEGAAQVMLDRLLAQAQLRQGALAAADIALLNGGVGTLPASGGFTIDAAATRYEIIASGADGIVPYDITPLWISTDHPMSTWSATMPWTGLRAARTVEVELTATVRGPRNARRGATARVAIAQVPPYQYAIDHDGVGDLCMWRGGTALVSGGVRSIDQLYANCPGVRRFAGTMVSNRSIGKVHLGTDAQIVWDGGSMAITGSTNATDVEANPEAILAASGGRAMVPVGIGAWITPESATIPGRGGQGECEMPDETCGGTRAARPSLAFQNFQATGQAQTGTGYNCAAGAAGATCSPGVTAAISYLPYPFTVGPGTSAFANPANANRLWQGYFMDYRRESRCNATIAGQAFRTFRCPTNAFGYRVDVAQLPAIPGGVLLFRPWQPGGGPLPVWANPSRYQEVVYLVNAQTLAAPLTIISHLPVYILGSFNNLSRLPAMIDAPLLTVLPSSAATQLQQAVTWDSAGWSPPQAVRAHSYEVLHGVFRARAKRWTGAYRGEILEGIPGVFGRWDNHAIFVYGSVLYREEWAGATGPGTIGGVFAPYEQEPVDLPLRTGLAALRSVVWTPELRTAAGQPPGFWTGTNVTAGAPTPPGRSAARQANAVGGLAIAWATQAIAVGALRSAP